MFKTSEQCRLELVAYTMGFDPNGDEDGMYLDDAMPARAARVSFGKEDKTGKDPAADRKLMKYLADHQHMTPFEHQSATFLIECPLFVRSQIHRHRTFAYNEISRRYTEENLEFWVPTTWRKQAKNNRQASEGEVDTSFPLITPRFYEDVVGFYNKLLEKGVAREQARAILPQSLLTKFYMTGNLRNWAHFCKLRLDGHAQYEVQVVAQRIDQQLRALWPTAWGVLMNEGT